MSERLLGKVCIITGTGGSIGREAALLFAQEGALVVGCDLHDFECGAVGLRKQRNAAIRHSAVDVHEERFDFGSAFLLAKPDKEGSVKGKTLR